MCICVCLSAVKLDHNKVLSCTFWTCYSFGLPLPPLIASLPSHCLFPCNSALPLYVGLWNTFGMARCSHLATSCRFIFLTNSHSSSPCISWLEENPPCEVCGLNRSCLAKHAGMVMGRSHRVALVREILLFIRILFC